MGIDVDEIMKKLDGQLVAKSEKVSQGTIGKKLTIKEDSENCLLVDVCDSETRNEENKLRQALIKLNLIGNKHIPEDYFYGSKEQRSALLAGLLNTDGWARTGRGR